MDKKNTGGAAFPKAGLDPWARAVEVQAGMTLRDYFAARAPQTPDWFKHTAEGPFPFVRPRAEGESEEKYLRETLEQRAERESWINRNRAAKFFAWRWFYADAMLAAREDA